MTNDNNNKLENLDMHHSIGLLAGLPIPDLAFEKILSSLQGRDLYNLSLANPLLTKHVSPFAEQALREDGLPGETPSDLMNHYTKLEQYQKEVLRGLYEIAPGASAADMESDEGKAAVRRFLTTAIFNFTNRVCGAHSWYKHLPVGVSSHQFDFCFNPMVNMRLNRSSNNGHGGSWEKKVRGDGSEFHYTWLPTDEYRRQYGFFDFRLPGEVHETMVLRDAQLDAFHVPRSARGPAVNVTAAIHSVSYDLYQPILEHAVRQSQPKLVHQDLSRISLNRAQNRFGHGSGMRLPAAAAADLEQAAEIILARCRGVMPQPPTAEQEYENSDLDMARRALGAQRKREQHAIALSLRELCLRNLGNDLTPSEQDIRSMTFRQFR